VQSKELYFRLQLYVHQYYNLYTYELASIIFVTKGRVLQTGQRDAPVMYANKRRTKMAYVLKMVYGAPDVKIVFVLTLWLLLVAQ
jgi:hypothetical protein